LPKCYNKIYIIGWLLALIILGYAVYRISVCGNCHSKYIADTIFYITLVLSIVSVLLLRTTNSWIYLIYMLLFTILLIWFLYKYTRIDNIAGWLMLLFFAWVIFYPSLLLHNNVPCCRRYKRNTC
ncbi:TspO/MBR-related protein, partial [Orpheovirus IHUMI-LCC2]